MQLPRPRPPRLAVASLALACALPATLCMTQSPAAAMARPTWGAEAYRMVAGHLPTARPPVARWGSFRAAAVAITLSSLGASVPAVTGTPTTVTAVVTAPVRTAVDGIKVTAQAPDGSQLAFPAVGARDVGPAPLAVTFTGTFALPGDYSYWVSVRRGSTWSDLQPTRMLTVTGPPTVAATAAAPRWSGAYVGWPQTAAKLDAFGAWRGRSLDVAMDYLDDTDWLNITAPSWFTEPYAGTRYAKNLIVSVPMLPRTPATSMQEGAAGAYDGYFRTLAHNLVAAGMGAATIRLGWEFDSPENYRWSAVPAPAAFAAYWRHVVDTMRSVSPSFTFDLCTTVAIDSNAMDTLQAAWPGDGYVDMLGLDVYDASWGPAGSPAARWAWLTSGPSGLNAMGEFAAAHHIPVSLDEWAVTTPTWIHGGGGGDDPAFISAVHDWLAQRPLHHETYSNVDFGYTDGRLNTGEYPAAAAAYRTLFGG